MSMLQDPDIQEMIADLSEGNPGAINVMCDFPELLVDVVGSGLTGSAIWCLYKDEANKNRERFAQLLKDKSRARMMLRDEQ